MGEAEERETNAQQALLLAATRSTVLLVNHRRGEDPDEWDWGSGTLLRAASGRLIVLSAWHVLKGRADTLVHIEDFAPPDENAIIERIKGPGDIGIAVLNETVSQRAQVLGLPLACLGVGSDCVVDRKVLLVGFPHQMQGSERIDERTRLEQFTCMAYWSTPRGLDNRQYSIPFKVAKPPHNIEIASKGTMTAGEKLNLKMPRGISGGGLYILQPQSKSAIWSAIGGLRLVGVLHEFGKQTQRAVPATVWRDWLDTQLARL